MFNEKTWRDGEKQVQDYMKKLGYKIIYTNFACAGVELDIVAVLKKKNRIKILKGKFKKDKKNFSKQQMKIEKQKLKFEIYQADDLLVVTEVKARKNEKFGKGFDAVDKYKKQNITRGIEFLLKQKDFQKLEVRVDVASVDDGKITYIENAF